MVFRPLLLLYLLYVFKDTASFNVEGIPGQVALDQIVTLVWTHEQGDPTSFVLVAATTPIAFRTDFPSGSAEATPLQTGTMVFQFSKDEGRPLILAAYDTRKESLEAVIKASAPPFFQGQTPITVETDPARISQTTTVKQLVATTSTQSSETQPPSTPGSSPSTVKARVIAGSVVGCIAAILLMGLALWYRRQKRTREGVQTKRSHWQQLDEDAGTVSPYPQVPGPQPAAGLFKLSLGAPASWIAGHRVEGHVGETTESEGTGQPNMDISRRLDLMSRELADLRRMVHDSRAEEESLPDYSSQ
ncbi:hypothetical protein PQX77_019923 [Marasmius sp. AFHP31]|nr:hypothetical protein PQX77_019923 [Marasmius sp. AFHP31]